MFKQLKEELGTFDASAWRSGSSTCSENYRIEAHHKMRLDHCQSYYLKFDGEKAKESKLESFENITLTNDCKEKCLDKEECWYYTHDWDRRTCKTDSKLHKNDLNVFGISVVTGFVQDSCDPDGPIDIPAVTISMSSKVPINNTTIVTSGQTMHYIGHVLFISTCINVICLLI